MDGFILSPGITPELTGIFAIELPLALGLGALVDRQRGVYVAAAANGVILAGIKIWTDWADAFDLLLSVAALAASVLWSVRVLENSLRLRWPRTTVWPALVGVVAVVLSVFKLVTDLFDPFDLFLADIALVAGLALAIPRRNDSSSGPRPRIATPPLISNSPTQTGPGE